MADLDVWNDFASNNRDPVYLQVVRYFKELIATSRLQGGQTIPSRRELAAVLKINPNTAQRAYKEMEEQQLIVTEGNAPSRITTKAQVLRAIRSELLQDAVDDFVRAVRRIDAPVEELLELVEKRYSAADDREDNKENGGTKRD